MGRSYTSEEMIAMVRRMGSIPNTGVPGSSDEDILEVLAQCMWTKIVPALMRIREEYFVQKIRVAWAGDSVDIPDRALLQKLRDIYLIDGGERKHLLPARREELASASSSNPRYYLEGNRVCVAPDDATGQEIEFHVFFRPSRLVFAATTADHEAAARKVVALNPDGRTVTLDSAPPASWGENFVVDIHSPSSGGEIRIWDAPAGWRVDGGANITFSAGYLDGSMFDTRPVQVGDWVCLAGEAAVPGVPLEYQPLLGLAAALRCAVSVGDLEVAKANAEEFGADMRAMIGISETRIEGRPPRITGRHGILRHGRR